MGFIMEKFEELVLRNDSISEEDFFRRCRMRGYPMRRKTFQRDMESLEKEGKVIRIIKYLGKFGRTTILKKPRGEYVSK
jgi:hypothetical protein